MNVSDILVKAVQCDQNGHILEAKILYEEGIEMLQNLVDTTKSIEAVKKARYEERITEYVDRSRAIKARIDNRISKGTSVESVLIEDNSVGHSYGVLFGKYFDEHVKEILLEEPYLIEKYHFQNLIMFMELALKKCIHLRYLLVVTKKDVKYPDNQRTILAQLQDDLKQRGITLTIKYDDTMHDRKIILSNGFIIKLGRGLHIFKANNPLFSLGLNDYDYRKCWKNEMDVFLTSGFNDSKPNKKA